MPEFLLPVIKVFTTVLIFITFNLTTSAQDIDFSADEYSTNFDTMLTTAHGNVKVSYKDQKLNADHIEYQAKNKIVKGNGHFKLYGSGYIISGSKAHWDLDRQTGTFENAELKIPGGLSAKGKKIIKYGPRSYKIENGSFTTCQNCTPSWSVSGRYIDLTLEDTAYIHHMFFNIRERPIMYLPYAFFPIGVSRKSGLLFPEIHYNKILGTQFLLRHFWDLGDNMDNTLSWQYMTKGGSKIKSEYRYAYSDRTFANITSSYNKNDLLEDVKEDRFGASIQQRTQITPNFSQLIESEFSSDEFYDFHFEKDFKSHRLPSLMSNPAFVWQNKHFYLSANALLHQDNLLRDDAIVNAQSPKGMIQKLPDLRLSIPYLNILNPLQTSLDINYTRFDRGNKELDVNSLWIRSGDRLNSELKAQLPVDFNGYALWRPEVKLSADYYNFDLPNVQSNATRTRYAIDQSLKSEIWQVLEYDRNAPSSKKYRISFEPEMKWNYSDHDHVSSHKFFNQPTFAGFKAPQFDLFDFASQESLDVELGSSLEERKLRRHNFLTGAIGFRFNEKTQENEKAIYNDILYLQFARTIDLIDTNEDRYYGLVKFNKYNLELTAELSYQDESKRFEFLSDATFSQKYFKLGTAQAFGEDSKTYQFRVDVTPIDFISLRSSFTYKEDLEISELIEQAYGITYNSPSKCWFLSLDFARSADRGDAISPLIRLTYKESLSKTKEVPIKQDI